MSQFSDIVKQAAKRFPGGTRHVPPPPPPGGNGPKVPTVVVRSARQHKINTAVADHKLQEEIARLTSATPAQRIAKGIEENSIKAGIERGSRTTESIGAEALKGVRKGALSWMEGKAIPAVLTGTLGTAAGVVHAQHVAPWLTKKLSPKETLIQKLVKNPSVRKLLLAGSGAAALAGGVAIGESMHSRVSNELGKRRAFSKLMVHSPDLVKRDPKHATELFEALYTFNKDLAKNPLTASSFIKTRMQYKDEGLQPMDVKTLTEVGKNMRDSRGGDSFLGKIFGSTANVGGMTGLGVGVPPQGS